MFGIFKKKKQETYYFVINLNAKVMPMDRGECYEDPLDEKLQALSLGEVTGGGTLQAENGEIESCDIEVQVNSPTTEIAQKIVEILSDIGVPKGSSLLNEATEEKYEIGESEGLGIYLNGTDLPSEVYEKSDINVAIEELNKLVEGIGEMQSYWEGSTETALYFYGSSFAEMNSKIESFVEGYPLFEKCRIVQIA